MERLDERLADSHKALATLEVPALRKRLTIVERDAALVRFAYTFESVWKTAQRYLAEREGKEINSPKGCIRASGAAGLLTVRQTEAAIEMADDRNLVVDTYKAALAERIRRRLPRYARLLRVWLDALTEAARTA